MSMIEERVRNEKLRDLVMTPDEAAAMVEEGMTVGFSGFTSAGYPKLIPPSIAKLGKAKGITVLAGASTGPELDGELAQAGLMQKRAPFQSDKTLRGIINKGEIDYCDIHLSQMPKYVRSGVFGEMEYAIVECTMIDEECGIVPTLTLGAVDTMIACAKNIILEINTAYPVELKGLHDIYQRDHSEIIPITKVLDRAGSETIYCPPEKIKAIVFNDNEGRSPAFAPESDVSNKIAGFIIDFLKEELSAGRLGKELPPLQSGLGNVANAVLNGLKSSGFRNLRMFTEVIQDTAMELIRDGIIDEASTTAISLSKEMRAEFYGNIDYYKEHVVVRPQNVSNNPEMIQRFGVIAMNTAVEADIYGNVNSTHVMGSSTINGIGGSCDFARNAGITIFMTPATAKDGNLSCIVPMVSHVDSTEHDVHIIVTEYGLADLRGKSPKERAELMIEKCCAPEYRDALRSYYEHAKDVAYGQQTLHDLSQALSWHTRYLETGTMRR